MPEYPASAQTATAPLDALIVGGGIAGLWLLNRLHHAGYDVALLEAEGLGCGQTLGSQGMVHGGLKYALGGSLTGASEAIAGMPERWRDCLSGRGEVDLSGLGPLLSEHYYLFAAGGSLGRLTTFFASRALRGRIRRVPAGEYPAGLEGLDGVVYQLEDFVLDARALLARLLQPVAGRAYQHRVRPCELARSGSGWAFQADRSDKPIYTSRLILCAGSGNGPLVSELGCDAPMQLRPLKQVLVRHPALPPLYAHCLTGIRRPEPRLTITSHPDPDAPDRWLWYLGGQLATDGVTLSDEAQIERARTELRVCVPWIDWQAASFRCLDWDRAEPAQQGGRRPDEAFVTETRDCLVCWPTKLSLAPDLGDRVLARLEAPQGGQNGAALPLPPAAVGQLPWCNP